jgi:hypothetical protein
MPCTETIAFSFDYGFLSADFTAPGYVPYYTNLLVSMSGDLGSFTDSVAGPGFFNPNEGVFLALADPEHDEFDIFTNQYEVPAPVAPLFGPGDLYSCDTATCITDFSSNPLANPPEVGIFLFGPVTYTVRTIPEPSTLSLLLCGLFALGLGTASTIKKWSAESQPAQ